MVAALPPIVAAATAARVVAISHPPLVAAAGDRIAVTARLAGTGKRVSLGLVLGDSGGSAKGGTALGPAITTTRRSVRVSGRVPSNVAQGVLRTLLVCVDPVSAVQTGRACRSAGRIATSGTSVEERIAGARQSGRLSKADAVLFGVLALRQGSRAPPELRGRIIGPNGEESTIATAADALHKLPAAVRRRMVPFFVPPRGEGSLWAPARKRSKRRHRPRASAAATADCTGYAKLDRGYFEGNLYPWRGVPTSDGKAIVWYQVNADLKTVAAQDRATAHRYAAQLPAIWAKLTKEFGPPLSDGRERCFHGPDGRFDVYVDDAVVSIESRFAPGVLALTIPYPAAGAGSSCSRRPSWIAIRNDQSNWALAHEFMHALQFSHPTAACAGENGWWVEGSATWAGDFVYPGDNTEQRNWPALVASPLSQELAKSDYGGWPFWMMLARTQGTGVLRSIFTRLATTPPVPAVDSAIPGGFATQVPRFFLHAFNQSPVGDAGFAIPEAFAAWDRWTLTPGVPAGTSISLGELPGDALMLPSQRADGFPPLSVGAYQRVAVPDARVKEIRFTNDLAGRAGAHVDAMLHLADGSWKLADWTTSRTVTLCRDRAAENVRDLVIVSTNAGTTPLAAFTHTLHVASTCPFPKRFDGSWTRVYTDPSRGSWKETIKGTATYVRNPQFPPEADSSSQVLYDVQSAGVTWTVTGFQDNGTGCPMTFSGSGTDTPTTDHTGTNTDLGLENVSGHAGAPNPEPAPFYYSIRAGIDPSTAPQYDVVDCNGTSQEPIVLPYLEIGHPGPFTADTPPEQIVKSADPRVLQGHRTGTDDTQVYGIDDTWSFNGSD